MTSTILDLFDQRRRQDGSALAVLAGPRRLTYAELGAAVDTVASGLIARGVRAEQPVAVLADRSADLPALLLGVLKAGAALVPLDPAHPDADARRIVADSGATLLVADRPVAAASYGLPEHAAIAAADLLGTPAARTSWPPVSPASLSYLVYTSGTTGTPKGIEVSHASIASYSAWCTSKFSIGNRDRVLHLASLGFDVGLWEVFWPLTAGAAVVMSEPGRQLDASYLVQEAAARRVSVLHTTPVLLRRLIAEPGLRYCSRLRVVLVSSDLVATTLLNAALAALGPERALYHLYGVTEVSVESSAWRVTALPPSESPRLGSAISETSLYLLDEQLRPVAGDDTGELYLAGPAVARGYHGRPAATAAAFQPDPYGPPGSRMYRTGDLARRAGADLTFAGRADQQVKVHGHRIDLRAIESALTAHDPGAFAIARVDDSGGLEAFVAPGERPVSYQELRSAAEQALPAHAIPSVLYEISEVPVTVNGKVDAGSLKALARRLEPPRQPGDGGTELERILCEVFSTRLGLATVGPDEDFFALGGHSLLALEVVDTLAARHGLQLPVDAVFRCRSARELAVSGEISAVAAPVPGLVERAGPLPLSAPALDIWLAQQSKPGLCAYNGAFRLRLRGEIEVERLARAAEALVERHETLRTRYLSTPDGPRLVVDPWQPGAAGVLSVARVSDDADEEKLITSELNRVFDLTAAWPVRMTLLRRASGGSSLLFVLHHLAADGACTQVLLADLAAAYRGELAARDPQERDYLDYSSAPGRPPGSGENLDWWVSQLAGAQAAELPADSPRPARPSGQGGVVTTELPAAVYHKISQVVAATGSTTFIVLQSAVRVLLGRLAGQSNLVTAIPVSLRPVDAARVIGHFTQSLLVRADLAGARTFAEVVDQLRTVTAQALSHASTGIAALAERQIDVAGLQRVGIALQDAPRLSAEIAGLVTEFIDVPTESADFDLQFAFIEHAEGCGLRLNLHYDRDLFRQSSIVRYARYFHILLESVLEQPQADLDDLAMVSDADAAAWPGTAGPVVPIGHCCAAGRFTAIASERAAHPALVWGDGQLTYGELAGQVERLAAGLHAHGVRPGQVVGVRADRNAASIVAMLGVLRAGMIYLPLRAEDSPGRLGLICRDARAALVLDCAPAGAPEIPDLPVRVAAIADVSAEAVAWLPCPGGDSGAYLIFTSGTTGRPKGVLTGHRALVNRIQWAVRGIGFGAGDVHLLHTALDFDVSVAEILQPLLSGGTLTLPSAGAELDPWLLTAEIGSFGVTVLHFVPSVLKSVLDTDLALPDRVRLVMCSGEALPASLARLLLARSPGLAIHNLYGPTEAAIEVSWLPLAQLDDQPVVAIGWPIDNVRAVVLDQVMRRQPPMIRGQLYVGGVAPAAGYLGQAELTADRFVPDPFATEPGARLYATGDICYYDESGLLHFVERADRQVKVRGIRLELGAVESAIAAHPAVLGCAAVVDSADGLGQRLVAYVAVADPLEGDLPAIREQMLRTLPGYAVPDKIVWLDRIPLTPAGKVDRRAAAAMDALRAPALGAVAEGLMAQLAQVWAAVLGVERIGPDDHFFELGGHSLSAAQCAARLSAEFGVTTPVTAVFWHPRLADFSAWWAGFYQQASKPAAQIPRLADRQAAVPMSRAQRRLWLADVVGASGHAYDLALCWLLDGDDEPAAVRALAEVVGAHEILRTGYLLESDQPCQQVLDGWQPPVRRAGYEPVPARVRAATLLSELRRDSFALPSGLPPVRAATGSCQDGTVVVLDVHHIALDGRSMALVSASMADAVAGRALSPAELPVRGLRGLGARAGRRLVRGRARFLAAGARGGQCAALAAGHRCGGAWTACRAILPGDAASRAGRGPAVAGGSGGRDLVHRPAGQLHRRPALPDPGRRPDRRHRRGQPHDPRH